MVAGEKRRVLLVEDDPLFREMVANLLNGNYEVMAAADASEGLSLFCSQRPEAVLLDLVMPGRDGLWALRMMRREDPTVAIAILTGHGALESAKEAISLGARFYVEKPVDLAEVKRIVQRCCESTLEQRRQQQTLQEMKGIIHDLHAELEKKEEVLRKARLGIELLHDLAHPLEEAVGQLRRLEPLIDGRGQVLLGEGDRIRRSFYLVERCMERCRLLADISRCLQQPDHPEEVSLGELLRRISQEAQKWAGEVGIKMDCRILLQSGGWRADAALLEMALKNVVLRALQAAAGNGGVVRVAAVEGSGGIEINIEDHGPGCDLEDLARELRPYFSERQIRQGAGFGLLLSARTIEKYGGRFHLQSSPERGTVCFIRFPTAG